MPYTLAGGGTLCGIAALVLLIVSTATDYWMQYRYSGNFANQGLWRFCVNNKCHAHTLTVGLFALLALAIYTGMTLAFFGKRYIQWWFSWSFIIGWFGTILAITAGKSFIFLLTDVTKCVK
ncbi:Lens fiber membrane intrinsic protein [Bagarius yarrelli]|uniref:Lens fiber membrane intrinsic protein n=1 Tax=Bagarius yarrelli TaxID=175774 RepID=A0A556TS84_BAGYA|nr:Lens fiber membrane intrinsic protein [Bagarius yarrelli]